MSRIWLMSTALGLAAVVGGASAAQASLCSVLEARKAQYLGELIYGEATTVPLPITTADFPAIPANITVGDRNENQVENPFVLVGDRWHFSPPELLYARSTDGFKINCGDGDEHFFAVNTFAKSNVTFNIPARTSAEVFNGSVTITFKGWSPNGELYTEENYFEKYEDSAAIAEFGEYTLRYSESLPRDRLVTADPYITGGTLSNLVINSGLTAADGSGKIVYSFTVTPTSTGDVFLAVGNVPSSAASVTLRSADRTAIVKSCERFDGFNKGKTFEAGYANFSDQYLFSDYLNLSGNQPGSEPWQLAEEVFFFVDGRRLKPSIVDRDYIQSMGGPVSRSGAFPARLFCGIVPDGTDTSGPGRIVNGGQGYVSSEFTLNFLPDNTLQSLTVSDVGADGLYTVTLVMKEHRDHGDEGTGTYYSDKEFDEAASTADWFSNVGVVTRLEMKVGDGGFEPGDGYLYGYRLTIKADANGGPATLTAPPGLKGGGDERMTFAFTAPAAPQAQSVVAASRYTPGLRVVGTLADSDPNNGYDPPLQYLSVHLDPAPEALSDTAPQYAYGVELMCHVQGADTAWAATTGGGIPATCAAWAYTGIEGVALRLTGPEAANHSLSLTCETKGGGVQTVGNGEFCGARGGQVGGLRNLQATITKRP